MATQETLNLMKVMEKQIGRVQRGLLAFCKNPGTRSDEEIGAEVRKVANLMKNKATYFEAVALIDKLAPSPMKGAPKITDPEMLAKRKALLDQKKSLMEDLKKLEAEYKEKKEA